ncbi:hypothetical protein [Streptomyces boninensis]|uniref:hypothetical protein n=1 Tax=Streptomyces boninensis TaxID=2039455 RepID=UPI003B213EDD
MYIPRNALSGSRRSRLVNSALLTVPATLLGVVLAAVALNSTDRPMALAAFAATSASAFLITWWCVRFWYVNYRADGTSEPPEDPAAWPWLPAPAVLAAIFLVTGVRALRDGDAGSAVGSFAFGGFLLLMTCLLLFLQLIGVRERRSQARQATAAARNAAQPPGPQHPQRAWGSIDRR